MTTREDREERVAVIHIRPQMIAAMLDLPEGLRVRAVAPDRDGFGIRVLVEGPELRAVPPNEMPPTMDSAMTVDVLAWPDGQPAIRYRVKAVGDGTGDVSGAGSGT